MTEEIIKCKYFVKEYEDFTNVCELGVIGKDGSFMACEYNPNCYYKQLQRLKQTNEALGKAYNELINTVSLENYNRLKQENERLKKQLDFYAISATVPTVMYNRCERERCKYGSALEEIKEMILQECKRCGKNITEYCERCWVNDTLNKINEVLG